jgi:hypothetical protein
MHKSIHFLATLLASMLVSALSSTPAMAFESHKYSSSFGPGGVGSGTFSFATSIAVDESSGDVYVYEASADTIEKFTAAGEPANFSASGTNAIEAASGGGSLERQLAVDNSSGPDKGDIYLAHDQAVEIYSSAGTKLGELTGGEGMEGAKACGVAVDPTGAVYVAFGYNTVKKYIPATNPVTNTGYTASLSGLYETCNIAADSKGNIYAVALGPVVYGGGVRKYAANQFNTSGTPAITTPPKTLIDEAEVNALAVDTSNDSLYVPERGAIARFSPYGGLVSRYEEMEPHTLGSLGIAVNATTGAAASHDIYVTDGSRVDIYAPELIQGSAPSIEGASTSQVTASSATLGFQINPNKTETTCALQYVTESTFEQSGYTTQQSTPCEPSVLESEFSVMPSTQLSGLDPATRYHYRGLISSSFGQTAGGDQTFTTFPLPPEVSTGQAAATGGTSETISGTVTPRGNDIWDSIYKIQYGLTSTYGSQIEGQAGAGDSAESVSSTIPDLSPGTYHYRVVAKNAGGENAGADATFTVSGAGPLIGSASAQFVNENSAVIQGDLNPEGEQTSYEVQYGISTAYGSASAPIDVAPFTSAQGTITAIAGLTPGTTYHYRVVATNAGGTAAGPDETFRTTGVTLATAFTSFAIPSVAQIPPVPFTFPRELPDTSNLAKRSTSEQKLAAALKRCTKKSKSKRAACRKQARKRYDPPRKKSRKK